MKMQLTSAGKSTLLHSLQEPIYITFTKIQYGNGEDAGSDATHLSNMQLEIAISDPPERDQGSEFVKITATFSNSKIESGFRVKETGIFIQNPDDSEHDILFAYGYVDDSEAIYIPSVTEYTFETTDSLLIYVGETQNITAIISQSMATASKAELDAHKNNQNNPHNVTKEQIGLGNVPNVPTDSQIPTVGEIDSEINETNIDQLNLQNGETLSRLLTKIANGISWLISHIRNKNNPHSVTRNQIGAAAQNHSHSTSDITAGTLPVSRGGTGVNSTDALIGLISAGVGMLYKTGSYTGNGKYGQSNKITITYEKKPKFVLVQPVSAPSGTASGFLCLADVTTLYSGGFNDDVSNSTSDLHFTWEDDCVSWYGSNAEKQNNKTNLLYRYLIVY